MMQFEKLPLNLIDSQHYRQYSEFLRNWGSHVIMGVTTGTAYETKTSSETTERSTSNELKQSACKSNSLSIKAGATVPVMGFDTMIAVAASAKSGACSSTGVKSESKQKDTAINTDRKVFGGSPQLQAAFVNSGSITSQADLLAAKPMWHVIVEKNIQTVWEILSRAFSDTSAHYNRAQNLKNVYMNNVNMKRLELPEDSSCVMQNIYPLDAADGLSDELADIKECRAWAMEQQHEFYAWKTKGKYAVCETFLSADELNLMQEETNPAVNFAGPTVCSDENEKPLCSTSGRTLIGTSLLVKNQQLTSVPNANNCQQVCKSMNSCRYWNFFTDKLTCELFSRFERFEKQDSCITGPKECIHYIIEEREGHTAEQQYDRWLGADSFWSSVEEPATYIVSYTSSQCLDYWRPMSDASSINDCAKSCDSEERCVFFGVGRGSQAHKCFNGGFSCTLRDKNVGLEFDIYKLMSAGKKSFTLLQANNQCMGNSAIPFCACSTCESYQPSCLAETVQMCSTSCKETYDSQFFLFQTKQPEMPSVDRCQCYSNSVMLNHCTPKNCGKHCPASMKWDLYANLGEYSDIVENLACPSLNTFVTSSRPAISRVKTSSLQACATACSEVTNCKFGVWDVKRKVCYLQAAPIIQVSTSKTGFIACKRDCCKKLDKNPQELFWNTRIYV